MKAGKIVHWKKLEFRLQSLFSCSVSGSQISVVGETHLFTGYTQNQQRIEEGISLSLKNVWIEGEISRVYRLVIPTLGIESEISHSGFNGSSTMSFILNNVRLYCTNNLQWRFLCDGLEWYIDDTLQESFDGCDLPSSMLCPSSVPLLGIPAELGASCQMDPMPFMGYGGDIAEHDALVTFRVHGGWRFLDDEGWQVLPVKVAGEGSIGGENTYDGCVEARLRSFCERKFVETFECSVGPDGQEAIESSSAEKWEVRRSYENASGSIVLVPNLDKSVRRMNEDYSAVIFRGHFPMTNMLVSCLDFKESGSSHGKSTPSQVTHHFVHSGCLESHDLVTFEMSSIEEPFSWSSVAPFRCDTVQWEVHDIEVRLLSEGTFVVSDAESHGMAEVYGFQDERWIQQSANHRSFPHIDVEQNTCKVLSRLRHQDALALYINTIVHPHWSFFYWFPKGSKISRDQVHEVGRSDLLSASFCSDGLGYEIEKKWIGVPSHWWGIHRFAAFSPSFVSSVPLDEGSRGNWRVSGCSAKFGDDISVTPHEKVCTLEYEIGSFTQRPFMLPKLCTQVGVHWAGDNIKSLRVYLVNSEGIQSLLCDIPGTHSFLPGTEGVYAGSWGTGYGEDSRGEGRSKKYLADIGQGFSFGLFAGCGASHLRYEVLVEDASLPFAIEYPVFHPPESEVRIFIEDFRCSCILWPCGTGVRWGEWNWCPDGQLLFSPERQEPESVSSAVDWLCWNQCVIRGEIDGGLIQGTLRNLYDEYECEEVSDAAKHTHSFLVNGGLCGTGIVVNHFAEIPPLALFPGHSRLGDYKASSAWSQESWSYAQGSQYYVVSGNHPMHLFSLDEDTCVTQMYKKQVEGWTVTQCSSSNKDSKYKVVVNGQELAVVFGGRGYFAVAGLAVRKRRFPWNLQSENGGYHRVDCVDGEVVHRVSQAPLVIGQWNGVQAVTNRGNCCGPRLIETPCGRLYLLYWCGGLNGSLGVYRCFSDDNGFRWSEEDMIFPNGKHPVLFSGSDGVMLNAAFVPSSENTEVGTLWGLLHEDASNAFVFRQSNGADIQVYDDSFHIVESQDGSASWILVVHIEGEEEPSEWRSVDHGKSWEKIRLGGDD